MDPKIYKIKQVISKIFHDEDNFSVLIKRTYH